MNFEWDDEKNKINFFRCQAEFFAKNPNFTGFKVTFAIEFVVKRLLRNF